MDNNKEFHKNNLLSDYKKCNDIVIINNLTQIQVQNKLFLENILINGISKNNSSKEIKTLIIKKNQIEKHSDSHLMLVIDQKKDDFIKNYTVYDYLFKVTGYCFTQSELIYLRKAILPLILPPATRDEQRSKIKNIKCLESFSEKIIPFLQNPQVQDSLRKYIINRRI